MTSDQGISSRAIIQPRPAISRSSTSAIIVPSTSSNNTVTSVYPTVNSSA